MNFRSLDPRVAGQGMGGAGRADKLVWAEFFDASTSSLQTAALEEEFNRLWGAAQSYVDAAPVINAVEVEARVLAQQDLDQLLSRYKARTGSSQKPVVRSLSTRAYDRDPLVVAIGKKRADSRCEVPNCKHPPFELPEGGRYV